MDQRPEARQAPRSEEPGALKAEIERRWGTIDLLDILKETDFLTDFTDAFTSVATREMLDRATPTGGCCWCCSRSARTWGSGRSPPPATTARARPRSGASAHLLNRDNLRRAITTVVNATLEARDQRWWGDATSTASDSKRFGSWDSNLMTEYHARYGGHGVMIYWHVERDRLCIYCQLKPARPPRSPR